MTKDNNIYNSYDKFTFEDFKKRANDPNLSMYEDKIFKDILAKLPEINENNKLILDIGCGCSEIPFMLIDQCEKQNHQLILIDSEDMLSYLPDKSFITKVSSKFPDCRDFLEKFNGKTDAILTYSILHHIILDSNLFNFIDKALGLLSDKGKMLIGDIPNISKRKRFFASDAGIKCHQEFTGTDKVPEVEFLKIENDRIDDSIVMAILQRYRNFGFETYLLPQADNLPMASRREDGLIVKR